MSAKILHDPGAGHDCNDFLPMTPWRYGVIARCDCGRLYRSQFGGRPGAPVWRLVINPWTRFRYRRRR